MKMKISKKLLGKIFFIVMSLLFLALGLLGISRLHLRPGLQFQWEDRENQVVVTKVPPRGVAQESGLVKGDILLKIDDHPICKGQEMEFLLDTRKTGERVSLTIERAEEKLTISFILVPRWGKRFIILNLLLGILFWAVGVFVYLKKPIERSAQTFFWGCMIISATIMMVFWQGYPYDAKVTDYFLSIIYFILYPTIPAIILYFFCIYPDEKRILHRYKFLQFCIFLPCLGFIILLEVSYLSVIHLKTMETFQTFWNIFTGFRIYFILYLAMSIGCLIHSYIFSETKESQNKIQWVLWSICLGIAPFLFLWTLPQALGRTPLIPEEVNYIFLMIIPLAFAFSIVKYQVLDIEIIINRSIVYLLVTGTIVIMYLVLAGLAGYILGIVSPAKISIVFAIICTLIAAGLFSPIKQRIQTFVDKTFYRVKYNYRLAIKEFGNALYSAYNQIDLINLLMEKINAAIPFEKIALMLRSPSTKYFEVSVSYGMIEEEKRELRFDLASDLVQIIDNRKVSMVKKGRADFTDAGELPTETVLDKIGIELLIPIIIQGQLMGFLIIGKKLSNTRFSEEDIELLTTMTDEGFIALERLRLQETIILERAEKEKMEELNRLKSEFISHVSHELRTPLTSICWSVENLLDGIPEKPSPKVSEYLTGIHDSSQHLGRMIENLLDISKIEAGKIEMYPERLNLFEEIKKSIEILRQFAEKKDINLEVSPIKNLWIKADPDYLQTILTNLLTNAIKYTHKGDEVNVDAKSTAEKRVGKVGERIKDMVAISVVDNGSGIPKEKQKVIFERFERIKKEKAAREKGLGLGLHIVKKLVELQGGRIWIKSEVDKGCTFTFTLPRG